MTRKNVRQPDERARAAKALDLRQQGRTWQQVANELDYADRSGAYKAVQRLLDRTEFESVQEHRALESDRLDALHASYWPAAIHGDVKAAELVLKISAQRCRLLGLDAPTKLAVAAVDPDEDFAATAVKLMTEIMDADAQPLPDFLASALEGMEEVESEPWSNIGK